MGRPLPPLFRIFAPGTKNRDKPKEKDEKLPERPAPARPQTLPRRTRHPALHRPGNARDRRIHRPRKLGVELRRRIRLWLRTALGSNPFDRHARHSPAQRGPSGNRHRALPFGSRHALRAAVDFPAGAGLCRIRLHLHVAGRDTGRCHCAGNAPRHTHTLGRGADDGHGAHHAFQQLLQTHRTRHHRWSTSTGPPPHAAGLRPACPREASSSS